jgi:ABC-2 type transport system ATP-binding protein
VRGFLREYNRKYNATVLLTSHYMADITSLCKRVLLIHQGRLFYDGPLAGIVDRFAPYREVKLDFTETVAKESLAAFGEVESHEGRSASLIVRREALTETTARILSALPVADLTISDPPIENIIGELFSQGTMAEAKAGEAAKGTA